MNVAATFLENRKPVCARYILTLVIKMQDVFTEPVEIIVEVIQKFYSTEKKLYPKKSAVYE